MCLVQEKAQVPKSLHDIADICHATMCLEHTGIFFTQCSKPLSSCLFYKENLYSTPVGESLLMIRVFIPS